MKFIFLFVILLLSLSARDNPFTDIISDESLPISTNVPKTFTNLQRETFRFPSSARIIKRVIIEYQNLDGSINTINAPFDKKIDWHMPLVLTHKKAEDTSSRYQEKIKLSFIKLFTKGKQMKLTTKDKLIRDFMLVRPHRVILDFKGSSQTLSKKYTNFTKPFNKVRFGNHDGYYRVVVELDGQYEYQVKSEQDGLILTIK